MATPLITIAGSGSMVDIDATILIQLGIFLFTLLVLRSLLFRPVIRLIEARREATEGALETASSLEGEAEQLNHTVAEKLADMRHSAGTERDRIIDAARAKERDTILQARSEAHDIVEKMRRDTEKIAAETRRQLAEETEAIVSLTAAKALNRPV